MFASSAMLLGLFSVNFFKSVEFIGKDNAVYGENPLIVDYDKPAVVVAKAEDVSATSISIHYHNDDAENAKREFWVWCSGVNGSAFTPTVTNGGKDMELAFSFTGEHANFADKKGIYFIVKYKTSWVGQSDNMFVDFSEFPPDASGKTTVWCVPGEGSAIEMYKSESETKMDRFQVATFTDWKTISVTMTAVPTTWKLYALTSSYMSYGKAEQKAKLKNYLIAEGSNPTCKTVTYNSMSCKQFDIKLNYTAKVNVQYYLEGVFPAWAEYTKTKYVSFHQLYKTQRFETYYTYSGNDLGATYSTSGTTFKVWAPTAAIVRVLLYDLGTNSELAKELGIQGTDNARGYNMSFQPGGIWQVTINGDLNGKYYKYYVENSLGSCETCDPYAKACGVNGDRAMICDFSKTNPEGWNNLPLKWDGVNGYDIKTPNELSVYEVHIRDLTMDSSWNGKKLPGTYSAFVEKGTTVTVGNETAKTGFDHLEEMGVNTIQLVPVFDNDNLEQLGSRTYNWGYNPLNYNCVDGSYATDPYNGDSRIKEFKALVLAFANNANKTRIVMDVVYNHVSSAPASCFNKLMPRYYFRMEETTGNYFDGSGCGNEVRSEATMMRKYIVDSLCWWASEYKIKGFRFDLMGLIDVGTIDLARRELYKIDPDIVIYGEGWTGDGSGYDYSKGEVYQVHGNQDLHDGSTTLTEEQRKLLGCVTASVYRYLNPVTNTCYVGAFNDAGRNAIRGDNNLDNGWGFIDQGSGDVGDKSRTVADMMIGYHTGMGGNPNQCVNYASCHDNYSLFDQLMNGIAGATWTNPGLACAAVSAVECAIMFSNGIAFMQGGEEVFRSKEVTTAADRELVKESDSHTIKGKLITHNAYNLSDAVNAFKWGRKISINGVSTKGYVEEMAKAIKLRNKLAKYDYAALQAKSPYSSESPFNVWGYGSGSTAIGIKNDHYFCFISGVNDAVTPFDASLIQRVEFTSNKTADYNGYEVVEGGIKLGWYTTVCIYS